MVNHLFEITLAYIRIRNLATYFSIKRVMKYSAHNTKFQGRPRETSIAQSQKHEEQRNGIYHAIFNMLI